MTLVLMLLGFGLGAVLVADRREPSPRARMMTPRERAIQAQDISARASRLARDLAARSLDEVH